MCISWCLLNIFFSYILSCSLAAEDGYEQCCGLYCYNCYEDFKDCNLVGGYTVMLRR